MNLGNTTLEGKSGTTYDFKVYSLDTSFEAIGAVYCFVQLEDIPLREQRDQNDLVLPGNDFTHVEDIIYVGQTSDLSIGFEDHRVKQGANCIYIHEESSNSRRLSIERDLITKWKPSCNE